jgi:hypothetical protein
MLQSRAPLLARSPSFSRRRMLGIAAAVPVALATSRRASAEEPSAAQRMSEAGPEETRLRAWTGTWDVVASLWPAPGAQPVVARGIVAERTMIGPILQEIMHPTAGSPTADFRRLDYLNYDRVEARWKYVSMDTRFPVSIMPAWSFGPQHDGKITVEFNPQAFVGFGKDVEGRFMVSDMVISQPAPARTLKEQHVTMADGTGRSWQFVRYEYERRG